MITFLLGTLGILTIISSVIFFKDVYENRKNLEKETNWIIVTIVGIITNIFDTLGIGNFSTITASLRALKQINDRVIPGTLNVCSVIPVTVQAFAYITVVTVEPMTLIPMIISAIIGALIGARYVSKLPEKKVQLTMGGALLITASLMTLGQFGVIEGLGTGIATGLTGVKFIIAIIGNFILGALMTAGVGLYAPCMSLVYMLGMSPAVAFPIMMGSCAFLMPAASFKFIKTGAYNRKASLVLSISGVVGVLIAIFMFTSLSVNMLKWLVIVVVTYTGITMLRDSRKKFTITDNL